MDRHLAERMVGAAVLLGALVLVVPAILDGGGSPAGRPDAAPAAPAIDLQTRTIQIDGDARTPPVPNSAPLVPPESESVLPEPEPVVPAAAAAAAAPADAAPDPVTAAPPAPGEPPPAVREAPPATGDWFVQLGSFARRDNAERLAAAVAGRGFATDVSQLKGAAGPLFRVRAGPAPSRPAAEALARELGAAGYAGTVTRR